MRKFLCPLMVVLAAMALAACAAPETPPAAATATRTPRPKPTLTPRATSAPTATSTLALTEASEPPSPTPLPSQTPTQVPTPSVTPTLLGGCAEIWQGGYYVMTNDFKTQDTPDHRFDCMIIKSSDVVINCDNHSIEGINYGGYAFWIRQYNFPLLQTPNNVEIRNCKTFKGRGGVFAEAGTNLYIHDNDFSNNYDDVDSRRYGIFLGLVEGGGIRLDNVQGARIENNTTNDEAIGIDVRDSDKITIKNNTAVKNSAWGVNLLHTTNSVVDGNTLRDNVRYCTWGSGVVDRGCDAGGIILQDGSSSNVVQNNSLSGDNGNGIFLKAHFLRCNDDNTIANNKITNAIYSGIELGFCKSNKIVGNQISGSYDGILYGFDDKTEIRDNVISNMRNHGISSWNSAETVIDGNQILNSREAIYLFWDTWDPTQFSFLAPSPDNYASRDNTVTHNSLKGNAVAGVHLKDSIQDRVADNSFDGNGKNVWVEGKDDGNVIPDLNQ